MAKSLSATARAFIEANQGKHICACGCGGLIVVSARHAAKGIPKHMHGHHRRNSGCPLAERFWEKVAKAGPDECWLWTGCINDGGYGQIKAGRKNALAHRISWELSRGAIPDGMRVLHRCDVRNCVRPGCLFLGTAADNAADMVAKDRQAKGEANGSAKLTEAVVREARRRYATGGISQRELAKEFGFPRSAIRGAVDGSKWKHVPSG